MSTNRKHRTRKESKIIAEEKTTAGAVEAPSERAITVRHAREIERKRERKSGSATSRKRERVSIKA